ncbi:hypothetical protein ABBQ38_003280 [Trebouxia sp. C0009 RCD-2024]
MQESARTTRLDSQPLPLEHRLTLYKRLLAHDHCRAWWRFLNAVTRGGLSGLCLRGGLHLVSFLFGLIVKWRKQQAAKGLNFLSKLQDTARYAAFLATYSGAFVAVDEGIAALFGKRRSNDRHTSLALYILLRGATLIIRCGNKPDAPPAVRKALTPTRWKHGDTALMCVATSQILYSWIMLPHTLPSTYIKFLNRHGGRQQWHYNAARELCERAGKPLPPTPYKSLQHTRFKTYQGTCPCEVLHPGQSCDTFMLNFFPGAYLRALPVYLPVYLFPALLVHRKRLLDPKLAPDIARRAALGAMRSSLFLSLYCTLAWRGACVGFQHSNAASGKLLAMTCWTGGLASLAEKKSRRMELAHYCLARAVESCALCLTSWGYVRGDRLPKRIDVVIFSAATAAIMHCYSDSHGKHRDVFKSKYLNVLDFVFGNTGLEEGSIKHVPSTADLLNRLQDAGIPVPSREVLRSRTASFLGSLENLQTLSEMETNTPTSDRSDAPFGSAKDSL